MNQKNKMLFLGLALGATATVVYYRASVRRG